jgi:Right handed beta helix region
MRDVRRLGIVVGAAALAGLLAAGGVQRAQTWTPPAGVPAPSFGLVEEPGPVTLRLAPGTRPPRPIPAGTVLELQPGEHVLAGQTWTADGTSEQPVFLTMAKGAIVTAETWFKLAGQYVVVEGLTATRFKVQVLAHHYAFRRCDFSGHPGKQGAIISFGEAASDGVLYRNAIHDNGDKSVKGESDLHGIKISTTARLQRLWIVEHQSWNNNGDSFQCGSTAGSPPYPRDIYVVGGHFRNEGENGVDVKKCSHVFVVGVEIDGMTGQRGDPGRGIVLHDNGTAAVIRGNFVHHNKAEGIVSTGHLGFEILENRVEDNGTGIRTYSSTGNVEDNVLRRNGKATDVAAPARQRQNRVNPRETPEPTPRR